MKHKRLSWPLKKGRNQYYGNGFDLSFLPRSATMCGTGSPRMP